MASFPVSSRMTSVVVAVAAATLLVGGLVGRGWLALSVLMMVVMLAGTIRLALHLRRHPPHVVDPWGDRMSRAGFGFCAFFSLLMIAMIPPMQSPDESAHFGRAYGLLNDEVLVRDLGDNANQRVDQGFLGYIHLWGNTLPFRAENQVTREMEDEAREMHWAGHETAFYNPAAIYFPALYAPASLGIGLARWLEQPPWVAAIWARIGMWFVAIGMFWLALSIAQAGRRMMIAVMLLPMTLAQTGSTNLDSVTISGCFLVLALYSWQFSDGFRNAPSALRAWVLASSWLLVGLLALAKPVFLVLLLLPLAVAWRHRRWVDLLPGVAVLFVVLLWQFHVAQSFVNPNPAVTESAFARLFDTLMSPWQTTLLLLRTIGEKSPFYWESMVGILGWLDTPMLKATYWAAAILLLGAMLSDALRPGGPVPVARTAFGLTFVAYAVGTMLLLWVSWTPVGSTFIEGVQGRYFLPLLPAVSLALAGIGSRGAVVGRWWDPLLFGYMLFYMTCLVVDVPSLLIARYWL